MKTKLFHLVLLLLLPAIASAYDFEVDGIYYDISNPSTKEVCVTDQGYNYYSNKYSGNVTIPSSVTYEGTAYAVTSIGDFAFSDCSSLISVTIPNSVTSIGNSAFGWCSELISVTIPESVTSIGHSAFSGCSGLTSVTIPDSVINIGQEAFAGCRGLTSVTIGNSVTSIGYFTFQDCVALTSISIPSSVIEIGVRAFNNCWALTSATIGAGVEKIGENAFWGCTSLEAFYGKFASVDHRCLIQDGALIAFAPFGLESYTISDDVTSIGKEALSNCPGLKSVVLPNSIQEISRGAFQYCTQLAEVTLPNNLKVIDREVFSHTLLSTIEIPSSVERIGHYAFEYTNLNEVTIPDNVAFIGCAAFQYCRDLRDVEIGSGVTTMDGGVFDGCYDISSIKVKAATPPVFPSGYDSPLNDFMGGVYANASLYVPEESVGAYQNADIWKEFANIVGIDFDDEGTPGEPQTPEEDYAMSAEDVEVFAGEEAQLSVAMANKEDITAFQCDMYLPEGVDVKMTDGEYDIFLTDRKTRTHTLTSNRMADGSIRVAAYSTKSAAFAGNEGALFTVDLDLPEGAGEYAIQVKNIRLTDTAATEHLAEDFTATVTVSEYPLGDSNGDGNVTITDAVNTVNYFMELPTTRFIFKAADVNRSGDITISDVVGTVNIVMGLAPQSLPRKAATFSEDSPELGLFIPSMSVNAGETKEVEVMMDNEIAISALQFDMVLPDGFDVEMEDGEYLFDLTSRAARSHVVTSNRMADGSIRVAAYSTKSADFSGNSGAVVSFPLVVSKYFDAPHAEIQLKNVLFTTSAAVEYSVPGSVCFVSSNTGVEAVATEACAPAEYYNLQGVRVANPESGFYIVRRGNSVSKELK